jgi:hypothetical protein
MPPVLLLVFNRPAVVRQLVSAIRPHRPSCTCVAADGPRTSHLHDAARCARVRSEIARGVDWPSSQERAGVILEDDGVPAPDCLPFAAQRAITARRPVTCGDGPRGGAPGNSSNPRSASGHRCGRRIVGIRCRCVVPGPPSAHRRTRAQNGRGRAHGTGRYCSIEGLSVVPAVNLIHSIGDGDDATHQPVAAHPLRYAHDDALPWPLLHPTAVITHPRYDALRTRSHHGSTRRRLLDAWWALLEAFA